MTNRFVVALCTMVLPWLVIVPVATATSDFPVHVKVYGQHVGSRVTYHYQIVNNSPYEVSGITVGNGPGQGYVELKTTPPGLDYEAWEMSPPPGLMSLPPGFSTTPPGWMVQIHFMEGTNNVSLDWGIIPGDVSSPTVQPGATLGGMSITLEAADSSYLNNHVRVWFSRGEKAIIVPMELFDTTPPSLSVSVNPSTLWPPNEKLIPITATITVKDDYDPQPEIKLESITANEPLEKEDIKEAKIGTDDRQFKLKAEREGKSKAGRIYTVTYSATDGTGNKTTASATVTVPHDERKKDD
jgi:hypothetical protein